MKRRPVLIAWLALVLTGSASLWLAAQAPAREGDLSQIPIDGDDIAGVVRSGYGVSIRMASAALRDPRTAAIRHVAKFE